MAKTTTLKRRIGSVTSTRQITKAMELVAASKMRRAQENAFKSRDYRDLAAQLLMRLRELTDVSKHPLYEQRTVQTRLIVAIFSDRGLAGAYNSNLLREFTRQALADQNANIMTKVIVVGTRGAQMLAHINGIEVVAAYEHFPERPTANDIRPILDTIMEAFAGETAEQESAYDEFNDAEETPVQKHTVDAVDLLYTDYKTSITQIVKTERLLPAAFTEVEISPDLEQATFEPSPAAVLNAVTLQLIESQLGQAFRESDASEQSMRMLAMKNATDNASDLIDDLRQVFNTARQAAITQEIAEITGGAEAIGV